MSQFKSLLLHGNIDQTLVNSLHQVNAEF